MQIGHSKIYDNPSDARLAYLAQRALEIFTVMEAHSSQSPLLAYQEMTKRDLYDLSEYFFYLNRPFRRAIRLKTNLLSSAFYLKPNSNLRRLRG